MSERFLFTFIVAEDAKDRVVDLLLSNHSIQGFTAVDSQGFSREHSAYDVGEQIAGFRRVCRFEILGARAPIYALREHFLEAGVLSGDAAQWIVPAA